MRSLGPGCRARIDFQVLTGSCFSLIPTPFLGGSYLGVQDPAVRKPLLCLFFRSHVNCLTFGLFLRSRPCLIIGHMVWPSTSFVGRGKEGTMPISGSSLAAAPAQNNTQDNGIRYRGGGTVH